MRMKGGEDIVREQVIAWLLHPALIALALVSAAVFILQQSFCWLRCTIAHRSYHQHGVRFATGGRWQGYCSKCGRKWFEYPVGFGKA